MLFSLPGFLSNLMISSLARDFIARCIFPRLIPISLLTERMENIVRNFKTPWSVSCKRALAMSQNNNTILSLLMLLVMKSLFSLMSNIAFLVNRCYYLCCYSLRITHSYVVRIRFYLRKHAHYLCYRIRILVAYLYHLYRICLDC